MKPIRQKSFWLAALVHRLSGMALLVFLPVHLYILGLAISYESEFTAFLHWSNQPLVKLAEAGLIFLLLLHILGGLRLMLIGFWPEFSRHISILVGFAGMALIISACFAIMYI